MRKKYQQQKGFTLIETLIYVACFALIIVAIAEISLSVNKVSAHVRALSTLQTSAINSLQNMSRDTKAASQVQMLSNNPAHFILTSGAQGNTSTQEYYVENNMLYVKKNNSQIITLTDSAVQVSNFGVYPISAGSSTALTTKLSLRIFENGEVTTENFQLTDVMNGK